MAKTTPNAEEGPKLVKVKLLKPHIHGGVEYTANAEIDVTEPEKKWLIDQEIIDKA